MSKEQLKCEVEKIVWQVGSPSDPKEDFSVESFLLNMDSLKFIELVTAVENHFSITMSSDEMMKFKSGNMSAIVETIGDRVMS